MIDLNVSLIPLITLVVLIGNTIYLVIRNANQTKIEVTQQRMWVLLRLLELKIDYQDAVRLLSKLKEFTNCADLAEETARLAKEIATHKEFIDFTQQHYDGLINIDSLSKVILLEMEHRVEAMRLDLKKEIISLEKIICRLEEVEKKQA